MHLIGQFQGGSQLLLRHWRRVLLYFQCAVEMRGDPILLTIADWFRQSGWNKELRVAKKMSSAVERMNPNSPKLLVTAHRRCTEILFSGYQSARVRRYETPVGRSKRVIIDLLPFKRGA